MNPNHMQRLRRAVDIVEHDPRLMDRPHPIGTRHPRVGGADKFQDFFRIYSSGTSMGSPAFFYYTLIPQIYDVVNDEFIDDNAQGMECFGRSYAGTDDFVTDQIVTSNRVALCDNVGDPRENGLFYICSPLTAGGSSYTPPTEISGGNFSGTLLSMNTTWNTMHTYTGYPAGSYILNGYLRLVFSNTAEFQWRFSGGGTIYDTLTKTVGRTASGAPNDLIVAYPNCLWQPVSTGSALTLEINSTGSISGVIGYVGHLNIIRAW